VTTTVVKEAAAAVGVVQSIINFEEKQNDYDDEVQDGNKLEVVAVEVVATKNN
jgi:hypothetical protein